MVFLFRVRYSGLPVGEDWAACVEDPELDWVDPYLEEIIDAVTGSVDCDAFAADLEIRRRCFVAGGSSAQAALANLLENEKAEAAVNY